MPSNHDPQPGSQKKGSQGRKHRPAFEVPPEVTAPAPVAWVYRAEAADPPPPPSKPVRRARRAPVATDPTGVMLAAVETLAHTVAASTRLMLAAASLMGAPIEVTRKILGFDQNHRR